MSDYHVLGLQDSSNSINNKCQKINSRTESEAKIYENKIT